MREQVIIYLILNLDKYFRHPASDLAKNSKPHFCLVLSPFDLTYFLTAFHLTRKFPKLKSHFYFLSNTVFLCYNVFKKGMFFRLHTSYNRPYFRENKSRPPFSFLLRPFWPSTLPDPTHLCPPRFRFPAFL